MTFHVTLEAIVVLTVSVAWQQTLSNSGCVSDRCYCFPGDEIECAEAYMTRVPKFRRDPENSTLYNYIDLSLNRFRKIDARSFRNLRVRMIKIWQNRVSLSLDGRAFRGLEETLQTISIRYLIHLHLDLIKRVYDRMELTAFN
jgi:hypothetical protein